MRRKAAASISYDAICPRCGSLPRNRLLKLAIESKGLLSGDTRLLHFAPEANVRDYVGPRAGLYRTADLYARGVDLKLNHPVKSLRRLLDEGRCDAVFVGSGAPQVFCSIALLSDS